MCVTYQMTFHVKLRIYTEYVLNITHARLQVVLNEVQLFIDMEGLQRYPVPANVSKGSDILYLM